MVNKLSGNFREKLTSSSNLLIALALALSGLMPIILNEQVGAAQLTNRSATISTSQAAATGVSYTLKFRPTVTGPIQSMIFQFCNTPLGGCVLPGEVVAGTNNATDDDTEIDVSPATAAPGTWNGNVATAFTEVNTDTGACNDADTGSQVATMYCVQRTAGGNETLGVDKDFTITGITNPTIPSGNNQGVYVRITTFSDTSFGTPVDAGTVAASIVNQLNVSGRIQERLVFCVFALDDTAGSTIGSMGAAGNMPTDCTSTETTATNVDIGVIDNNAIAYSPTNNTPPASLGNDRFGAAMVNTNASNGVTITYYATAAATGTNELRAFRVPGASCNVSGTSLVDQCFISADEAAGETLTPGTERFGMQIACVVNSTNTSSATPAPIGTTSNLGKAAGTYVNGSGTSGSYNSIYNAGRTTGIEDSGNDCENNPGSILSNKFAWNDTSTAQALISSDTVVDDEMVKLRFGATANATTPTGNYTVASTYIATPVF